MHVLLLEFCMYMGVFTGKCRPKEVTSAESLYNFQAKK